MIKKIEEDDQGIGWNDIGDFEIGQTIPFRYETKVPAMAGYDTYSLVFHDKMDPALDADLDSVRIAVMDGERSVPMPESAFRVETGVEGETFQVVVPDLKAFVDEVFGQDARGQTIVVRYDARLNETAADQTGRPGFENAVRLEFSNNPDSDGKGETGFTPWDTVVCFTYRLEGAKVNEAGTRLEGARFRLYRDEACADEVRLKKIENGYVRRRKRARKWCPTPRAGFRFRAGSRHVLFEGNESAGRIPPAARPDPAYADANLSG